MKIVLAKERPNMVFTLTTERGVCSCINSQELVEPVRPIKVSQTRRQSLLRPLIFQIGFEKKNPTRKAFPHFAFSAERLRKPLFRITAQLPYGSEKSKNDGIFRLRKQIRKFVLALVICHLTQGDFLQQSAGMFSGAFFNHVVLPLNAVAPADATS